MGGDSAPDEVIRGALDAAARGATVCLVGDRPIIEAGLAKLSSAPSSVKIVHAGSVIKMAEHPAAAVRTKRDSSVSTACRLVKQGEADAVVSAGNSGATLAAGLFEIGRLDGVERPALGSLLPTFTGNAMMIDMGANADCKPDYLVQFAAMGAAYADRILDRPDPRIGLLNMGEEAGKGNQFAQEAFGLLQRSGLPFIGNVEPKDLLRGHVDVAVTDGFTGNLMLKSMEAAVDLTLGKLREGLTATWYQKLAAAALRPALRKAASDLDYAEYGGAPLLGVNGTVIICHGRSQARAITSAVLLARRMARQDLVTGIESRVADLAPAVSVT